MMATRTSIGLAVLALTLTAAAAAAASSGEAESIATNGAPDGHCDGGVDCDTSISATNTADELPPLRLDDLDLAAYRASVGKGKWFVKFFAPWCKHCQVICPHHHHHHYPHHTHTHPHTHIHTWKFHVSRYSRSPRFNMCNVPSLLAMRYRGWSDCNPA
jgi:hypothetical protein